MITPAMVACTPERNMAYQSTEPSRMYSGMYQILSRVSTTTATVVAQPGPASR
ncbi:MAG: hypothetical protein CM1200mP26_03150 [Acidimicrobiales bacterium]|nr:MAG: hypothetical protein CM1200mP26_03150 [Acidimicrobiales bacterium]